MQCIVIAQDPGEKDILSYALRAAGMSVAASSELKRVLASWEEHPADLLVVCDPQEPAATVKRVRETTPACLIVITEPLGERATCDVLDQGADLVLARPISASLLTSQATALGRRASGVPSFVIPNLQLDRITLETDTRTVVVEDREPKRLTQLEFRLLYTLMTNRGHVVPTEVLVERVWGYSADSDRELVRGLVSRLRSKIDAEDQRESLIETLPGVGYRFHGGDL